MRGSVSRTNVFWRRAIAALGLGATALLLSACFIGGGGDGPGIGITPGPTATATVVEISSPADAIAGYLAENGEEYAGDCADATVEEDTGKICTTLQEENAGRQAYLAGPAFSEFDTWLFVERSGGGWSVSSSQPFHVAAADVPGVPWPLSVGDTAVVTATGNCLNVREGPGLDAPTIDCLADGTEIVLAQGPLAADGFLWWRLEGRAGWVASDWLRLPTESP
jgi:hypothetical protein